MSDRERGCDAWACGATGVPDVTSATGVGSARTRLHVVVVRILADVADIENDGLVAEVFPPVRRAEYFGSDLAGLVEDGSEQLLAYSTISPC